MIIYLYLLYVWGGTLAHLKPPHTHSPDPDPVKHVLTRTTAHQRPSAAAVTTVTLLVSAQMQ